MAPSQGELTYSSPLFASFRYERSQVQGTYVQFAYNASSGLIRSYLATSLLTPVLYIGSIEFPGFLPTREPQVRGPMFEAQGDRIKITAHDDPTCLLEVRSDVARTLTIELPASATNVSTRSTPSSWPASSLSYTIGEEQARMFLGLGTFKVTGTQIIASMASSDLLVFKAVPAASLHKAEWKAVLDAIASGHVVAELDLVVTTDGGWVENPAHYRIDVSASPMAVAPGKASVYVGSTQAGAAVVLLAFDAATMPATEPWRLTIRVDGDEANRIADTLALFYAPESKVSVPTYSFLPFPGTVLALYLPNLASAVIDVESVVPPPPPGPSFDAASELALALALILVAGAAAQMFRRRGN